METTDKTKIQRRLSEQLTEAKLGKQLCHICNNKAKTQSCAGCDQATCALHSMAMGIKKYTRICDDCFHSHAIEKLAENTQLRDKVANDISELAAKRDSNTQALNRTSGKIRNLQRELIEKEARYKEKIAEIEKRTEFVRAEREKLTGKVPGVQKEAMAYKMQAEMMRKRQQEVDDTMQRVKIEAEVLVKERTVLVSELNEITKFIGEYVPVKLLHRAICSSCYQRVKFEFMRKFRDLVPAGELRRMNDSSKHPQKKQGACAKCIVF